IETLESEQGEDADILIADGRYDFANMLTQHVVTKSGVVDRNLSDPIDQIVLNRWLGLPIFLALMYLMFTFSVNVGGAFIDFFDIAAGTLFVDGVKELLTTMAAPDWLKVLLADGLGGGIQVVATFIPIIGTLYLFLSVLEDTGYMARAAYLMDRYMRVIGLPGKAFVPLIVGFGCNVPAIMASRTLEEQRDRTLTVMMTPFMSCGARLAVYALFAAAFFPSGGQNIIFALYLIGIAVAIGTGYLLKRTLLAGESSPLVMELPPYHIPQVRGVLINTWNRLKSFMIGAGKIIIIVVVCLSFLNSIDINGRFGNENSERSILSVVGRSIVPIFKPMGIQEDNWPATVGIFTGIFAKEAVVGTLDALYSKLAISDAALEGNQPENNPVFSVYDGLAEAVATIPENLSSLSKLLTDPLGISVSGAESKQATVEAQDVKLATFDAMVNRFDGAAGAFSYLLFILLYTPCAAAIGAINREIGARWTWFAVLWTTGVAYVSSVGVYQAATLLSHPLTSIAWLGGLTSFVIGLVTTMKVVSNRSAPHTIKAVGSI
ncbi:MAG: ferrous iron transport protein B, partial [Rhodospirillales bacterium]|nr:ferrous iron transport protein B [Rhodospirillales bacterium]